MPRVALVLPTGSYRGPDFVAAADELGVDLLVASDGSLGLASGRITAVVPIDCSDPAASAEAVVRAAEEYPIDAVVGVDDRGVVIAALAAAALGLPHNPVEAVAATRDKHDMRTRLAAAGVPQPRHGLAGDVDDAVRVAQGLGFPVVLKPRSLSASRGVIRADDPVGVRRAAERIDAILTEAGAGWPILIEEYLPGDEVAVEAIAGPGGVEVLAIFDKPDPLTGPFFEETLYVTPTRHDAGTVAAIESVVADAVAAIGLVHGPVHAEVRVTAGGPRVLEVAARSIGGLCGRSLHFGLLNQSLEVLILRAALGLSRRGMQRESAASGVMMLPIPADGVLVAVRGREAVAEVPLVTSVEVTVPLGHRIRPLPEGDRYLGFVFASGDDPGGVEAALREAHGLLEFVID
jgi:biotin carboxylase